jgi:hypothetical protein
MLVALNGCMTETVVDHAKGIDMHDQSVGKPNAAYYALVPLTVPADIVTSPFQLIFVMIFSGVLY